MKKKNIIISLIILILFILLIYFASKEFGYMGLIPTGNIDIFNIECNSDEDECDCNNNKPSTDVFSESGDLTVYDNDITWNNISPLRIFTNPAFEYKEIIAPGSSNTYQFVISNNNNYTINYSLTFIENNIKNINMVYKLKRNGKYIISNWVDYNELNIDNLTLDSSLHDTYSLEWLWKDSSNDTYIGSSIDSYYKLNINIKASMST